MYNFGIRTIIKRKKIHKFIIQKYKKVYRNFIQNKEYLKEEIHIKKHKDEIESYKNINFSFITNNYYGRLNITFSIIITIFNQENYIFKIYSSIIRQTLKEIEIIFIDDNSNDNSENIIKGLKEKDKRIIYLKNNLNKGQFYSRNIGVLKSRGEYVLIIDPDDLLLNDIVIKGYLTAKFFNLDILQYYHIMGKYSDNKLKTINISGIYYQPQVSEIFFNISTRYLWDKIIKRKLFIKSIQFMNKKYRKYRFHIHNDDVACFGIFKMGESYGILKQVGYFYNRGNNNSTTKKNFLPNNINKRVHCFFNIMDYYFVQSKNNNYEKSKGGYNFYKIRLFEDFASRLIYLTKGFSFIYKIINLYVNSNFLNQTQKNNLLNFKNKLFKIQLYNHK